MKKLQVITNIIIVAILVGLSAVAIPFTSSVRTSVNPNVIYQGNTSNNKVCFMVNVYWGTEYIKNMLDVFDVYNPAIHTLKVGYGAGLRFRLNDARVNLRLDVAGNNFGEVKFYITATEAF